MPLHSTSRTRDINDGNTYVILNSHTNKCLDGRTSGHWTWIEDPKGAWSFTNPEAALARAEDVQVEGRLLLLVIPRREALVRGGRQLIPGVHNA